MNVDKSRRQFLVLFCQFATVAATGCGSSSADGGGGTPQPSNTPPPATTTTVAAAINSQASDVTRSSTLNGDKITHAEIGGAVVDGENIVYTVNNQRDDGTKPEDKQVRTGDVIDLFDLVNGSRISIVVA